MPLLAHIVRRRLCAGDAECAAGPRGICAGVTVRASSHTLFRTSPKSGLSGRWWSTKALPPAAKLAEEAGLVGKKKTKAGGWPSGDGRLAGSHATAVGSAGALLTSSGTKGAESRCRL